MANADNKRATMTLYTTYQNPQAHWIRIVLAEKGVRANIVYVNREDPPQELCQVNPYALLPTLVDKDLVLYKTSIISEYLEERFPHPPLLSVYPVTRAKNRQIIYRIEQDWYPLLQQIEMGTQLEAQKLLQDSLVGLKKLFAAKPYFLSDEFTLVDCCIAPLLWRLTQLNIAIATATEAIKQYQARVFARPAFKLSLHEVDNTIRG